jgi:hypothetical protein
MFLCAPGGGTCEKDISQLEAVAVIADSRPTFGEEIRREDRELQGVGDAIDLSEREPDLGQVPDRHVADPSLTKELQVPRRDRLRAGGEGGQEFERRIKSGVAGGAVT